MSAGKHRLNRILAWSAKGAAAAYIGLLLIALAGRLLGADLSGDWLLLEIIGFFGFLLMMVSAPLWFLTWLAGWGKSPAGRFNRAASQGVRTGGTVLWAGLGLAGCVLAVLIAIRLFAAQSPPEETAFAAGLGLFVGIFGLQALRVGLNLNRDPRRAGQIARTTSQAAKSLALAIVVISPVVSVVWTVWTAIGMGEEWGWAVLVSPITLGYPILAGAGLVAIIGAVALVFAYVGKKALAGPYG